VQTARQVSGHQYSLHPEPAHLLREGDSHGVSYSERSFDLAAVL